MGGKSTAGKKLKSLTGWASNGNGTDAYGFSAFPAGYRNSHGNFFDEGSLARFWSAPEYNSGYAYNMNLNYYDEDAYLDYSNKVNAFSVRCLENSN